MQGVSLFLPLLRLELQTRADTVLAFGTSLAGMNADRLAQGAAERHQKSRVVELVTFFLDRLCVPPLLCRCAVWRGAGVRAYNGISMQPTCFGFAQVWPMAHPQEVAWLSAACSERSGLAHV